MAKRRKVSAVARRVFARARKSYRKSSGSGGIMSLPKYALGGAGYAVALIGLNYVPSFGLSPMIKRGLALALLWVIGGMRGFGWARDIVKAGITIEAFGLSAKYIPSLTPGMPQAARITAGL